MAVYFSPAQLKRRTIAGVGLDRILIPIPQFTQFNVPARIVWFGCNRGFGFLEALLKRQILFQLPERNPGAPIPRYVKSTVGTTASSQSRFTPLGSGCSQSCRNSKCEQRKEDLETHMLMLPHLIPSDKRDNKYLNSATVSNATSRSTAISGQPYR